MRFIPIFTSILCFALMSASQIDDPKEAKPLPPTPTKESKRLDIKYPLPPQPPLQERAKARGELTAVAIVNPDGSVKKVTEFTGSPTAIYAYKSFIEALRFVPSSKNDTGPWIVQLHLTCTSNGFGSPIRTSMNIKIIDVQDHSIP